MSFGPLCIRRGIVVGFVYFVAEGGNKTVLRAHMAKKKKVIMAKHSVCVNL